MQTTKQNFTKHKQNTYAQSQMQTQQNTSKTQEIQANTSTLAAFAEQILPQAEFAVLLRKTRASLQ